MKRHLLLSPLYCIPLYIHAQTTSPTFDSLWAAQFQSAIDMAVESGVPGVSMAITWPGMGTFIGVGGESAPGVPVTPDMRFGIGSMTKLFTAVLSLRLQELKFWSLDDHLEIWLPEWLDSFPHIDQSATLRQCLSHQAGFFDYSNDIDWRDSAIVFGPDTFFTPTMVAARLGEPHFPPGEGYSYSNTGYNLVALAMENATGQSYVENLHEYILDPFGLDSTFVAAYETPNGPVAGGWYFGDYLGVVPLKSAFSMYGAAGSIFSTASEITQWYHLLFEGSLLSSSSMEQLTDFEHASFYGLGLETVYLPDLPDDVIWAHRGFVPGYACGAGWDLKRQSALCILTNQSDYSDPFLTVLFPAADYLYFQVPKTVADAGLLSIGSPEFHLCDSLMTPIVEIHNAGSTQLTSVDIHFRVDSEPVQSFSWTGSLKPEETEYVFLSDYPIGPGSHQITFYTSLPNGEADHMHWNDTLRSNFYNALHVVPVVSLNEGFEGDQFPPPGWFNSANTKFYWGRSALSLLSGKGCVIKNNWYDQTGRTYDLLLPTLDLHQQNFPVLTYDWAYGYYEGSDDGLTIYVSTDCGYTYQHIYAAAGEDLKTVDADVLYAPRDTEWQHQVIDLSSYKKEEVMIKLSVTTAWGNNLYLDNIRVEDITSIATVSDSSPKLSVYPNPASEFITIQAPISVPSYIYCLDLLGRLCAVQPLESNQTSLRVDGLASGPYLIQWISEGKILTSQLMVVR